MRIIAENFDSFFFFWELCPIELKNSATINHTTEKLKLSTELRSYQEHTV